MSRSSTTIESCGCCRPYVLKGRRGKELVVIGVFRLTVNERMKEFEAVS